MPNTLYDRQIPLALNVPASITIAGVGGVGSWVAIFAAMSGVKALYLFDPDVLEESNRNRLPFCEGGIGKPKVEVVKNFIDAIRPDITVVGIQDKLDGVLLDIQLRASSVIIDCTDSPKSQYQIYNACKKGKVAFIRAGYDGTRITVTSAVSGWIKTDVEEEHYQVQPSWVVPASMAAALCVGKLEKFTTQEVALDVAEIGIPVIDARKRVTPRCRSV